MLKNPQSRPEMYQGADRTFAYPVYLAIEIVWALLAACLIVAGLIAHNVAFYWISAVALIGLAILHCLDMTMEHPRLLLKSLRWGAAAFAFGFLANYFIAAPYLPLRLAVIVFTAHYMWTGEIWTYERYRRQALKTFGIAHLEKREREM